MWTDDSEKICLVARWRYVGGLRGKRQLVSLVERRRPSEGADWLIQIIPVALRSVFDCGQHQALGSKQFNFHVKFIAG